MKTRKPGLDRFSLTALTRNQPYWHLDLWLLTSNFETINFCCLSHRFPTPRPRTGHGLQPVRCWVTQQEVSGGWVSEASSVAPHCLHYSLNNRPTPVHGKIVLHETCPWCQKRWGPQVKPPSLWCLGYGSPWYTIPICTCIYISIYVHEYLHLHLHLYLQIDLNLCHLSIYWSIYKSICGLKDLKTNCWGIKGSCSMIYTA